MERKKIRKYIIISLALIIYTVLLIAIMQNRNVSIIAKYEDMSKAMPESTEIADLQKQIERLQKENEDLAAEISKATATEDKILSGEKVWTNGNITTGTMETTTSPEIATIEGTGIQTIDITPGYYNKIKINQTNAYNKGITDGRVGYYTSEQYTEYGTQQYNSGVSAGRASSGIARVELTQNPKHGSWVHCQIYNSSGSLLWDQYK